MLRREAELRKEEDAKKEDDKEDLKDKQQTVKEEQVEDNQTQAKVSQYFYLIFSDSLILGLF